MAAEVAITKPKPSIKMDRRHLSNWFQEEYQAASNNRGGKNIRNTSSGSTLMRGVPGIKLINSPPITRKIGYEIFSRWLSMYKRAITKNRANTNSSV